MDDKEGARPLLKWAGGKTQLLGEILPRLPARYGSYIEPFFGGGAVFFSLRPRRGVVSDSNPELISLYQQVARNVGGVIAALRRYVNTEEMFYEVRAQDWLALPPEEAAARTIYLNRTCFNGLYRVNRQGRFNVPFGRYKNPRICDEDGLLAAAAALRNAEILCADYLDVLREFARPGDLVFLDPPYLPVSEYSDFKRYTKEQFHESDHIALAAEVRRLHALGCHVLLTNSNHPLVHELYDGFPIDVLNTKRYISCNGQKRRGQDVIVTIPPERPPLPAQVGLYPPTRYMGSKQKLLSQIWDIASGFPFASAADLFSGSGIVGYLFKSQGKAVVSNDYMAMSATFAKAMIENNTVTLAPEKARALLCENAPADRFVRETFRGLYYTDEENALIDVLRANIAAIADPYERAIAMTALIRACVKKRPRGIFTYTGARYDDGRRDLKLSLAEQFLENVDAVNRAVFDNGQTNRAVHGDAMELQIDRPDLVYIDPPYYSPLSDNEYVRRYHFVEGLARDWKGVEIQQHTKTKKFPSYPTPFSTRGGAADAFDRLFARYAGSILIVSYSSNSLPAFDEMRALLARHKRHVDAVPVDYRYSFGNRVGKEENNRVQEYLFVGF